MEAEPEGRPVVRDHVLPEDLRHLDHLVRGPLALGEDDEDLTHQAADEHHELVHAPAVDPYPLAALGDEAGRDEVVRVLPVGVEAVDQGANRLGELFLNQRFVGHPKAVVEALPQSQHLVLGEDAGLISCLQPFLELLDGPVAGDGVIGGQLLGELHLDGDVGQLPLLLLRHVGLALVLRLGLHDRHVR